MKINIGDRIRLEIGIYKALGFRGGRETAIVESVDFNKQICHIAGNGLHGFFKIHFRHIEKVKTRESK